MVERTLILKVAEGRWSACYSDRPDEKTYGLSMDSAIDRLRQRRKLLADGATMTLADNVDEAETA